MSAISLKFLKTFQIAAQVGSFATTAIKLRITAFAGSHQIRGLETQLAVALFTRGPRELTLTEVGKKLLEQIDPAFAQTFVPACSPGLLQTSGVSQFTDLARAADASLPAVRSLSLSTAALHACAQAFVATQTSATRGQVTSIKAIPLASL